MKIHTIFRDIAIGQQFVETKGNHNCIYKRIKPFYDDYDNPCNAVIVKPGKKHYEYFRDHESVKTH